MDNSDDFSEDSMLRGFIVPDSQVTDGGDEESQASVPMSVGHKLKESVPSTPAPPCAQASLDEVYDRVQKESFLKRQRKRKRSVSSDDDTLGENFVKHRNDIIADLRRLHSDEPDHLLSLRIRLDELSKEILHAKAALDLIEPLYGRCKQCSHCTRDSFGGKLSEDHDYVSAADGDDSDVPIRNRGNLRRRLQ